MSVRLVHSAQTELITRRPGYTTRSLALRVSVTTVLHIDSLY